jgi:hypothetical protein
VTDARRSRLAEPRLWKGAGVADTPSAEQLQRTGADALPVVRSRARNQVKSVDATTDAGLTRYRSFHLWMLVPFAISLLGFSYSYFLKLAEATFHQHVHGLSATCWYLLVIWQPYLITKRKDVRRHRTTGAIGLLLAGIVAGSAFTIIPKNIDDVATLDPNGFFNPTFAYFATLIDVVLVSMFIASVGLAVLAIKEKNIAGHVQWLMASVLFVLSPGLARLLGLVLITANKGNMEGITLTGLAAPAMAVMLVLIVVFYRKFGSFRHPSFALLVACHIPYLFVEPIGNNESMRRVLAMIFK